MTHSCSGVILAGGLNTRLSGKNKSLIKVGSKSIFDHIYAVFTEIFDEIILVTNQPDKYLEYDLNIVSDLFKIRSSLTGIHTGLFYATSPFVFFSACDTPFLNKDLVLSIVEHIDPGFDLFVPETEAGLEPLYAVYSKNCLQHTEMCLKQDKLKIKRCFKNHKLKRIPEKILRQKDPELKSFFNVNTPDDLKAAELILKKT